MGDRAEPLVKSECRFGWASRAVPLVAALLLASGMIPPRAAAHPLHTTLGELAYSPATGAVQLTLRVFADDFMAAVGRVRRARVAAGQSQIGSTASYLQRTVELRGRDGRPVPLHLQGVRREGDVFWITLHGSAPAGLEGGSLRNAVLFDLFDDQVNIVKVNRGRGERSLLFVRGDGPKRIP
jgi:hypothetical protein